MNSLSDNIESSTEKIEQIDAEIAGFEGKIAEATDRKSEKPADEKPSIFGPLGEEALFEEMGKTHDKIVARDERKPEMPVIEGQTIAQRTEQAYDWMQLSKAEKKLQ